MKLVSVSIAAAPLLVPAQAQDTRHVTEPKIPPACATPAPADGTPRSKAAALH